MSIDFVSNDAEKLASEPESAKDRQIGELEPELEKERDLRKEERVGWVIVVVILLDILLLGQMSNPVTPIGIFVLELIALLIFAKRSGIQYVAVLLDRLIGSVGKRIERGD